MSAPVDVLAVMGIAATTLHAENYSGTANSMDAAHSAVAELIAADEEYDAARRDWDHVTAHDPEETSEETWQRVADRFEVSMMRRAAALARVKGGAA